MCQKRRIYVGKSQSHAFTMSGIMPVPYVELAFLRYAQVSRETNICESELYIDGEWNAAFMCFSDTSLIQVSLIACCRSLL